MREISNQISFDFVQGQRETGRPCGILTHLCRHCLLCLDDMIQPPQQAVRLDQAICVQFDNNVLSILFTFQCIMICVSNCASESNRFLMIVSRIIRTASAISSRGTLFARSSWYRSPTFCAAVSCACAPSDFKASSVQKPALTRVSALTGPIPHTFSIALIAEIFSLPETRHSVK
eukprot:SAG31_NODE_7103_length_1787_cov_11.009544_2_plen_175_part_00